MDAVASPSTASETAKGAEAPRGVSRHSAAQARGSLASGHTRPGETRAQGEQRQGQERLPARRTYHVLDDLVLAVVLLDLEEVVAEIQHGEAPLLPQQHDDHAARPVQPVAEALPGAGARRGRGQHARGQRARPPGPASQAFLGCGPSAKATPRRGHLPSGSGLRSQRPSPSPRLLAQQAPPPPPQAPRAGALTRP